MVTLTTTINIPVDNLMTRSPINSDNDFTLTHSFYYINVMLSDNKETLNHVIKLKITNIATKGY